MRLSLAVAAALLTASIMSAQADEYCGFLDKEGARVRCGFSSLDQCKKAMDAQNAKEAVCLPDPDFARADSAVRLAANRF